MAHHLVELLYGAALGHTCADLEFGTGRLTIVIVLANLLVEKVERRAENHINRGAILRDKFALHHLVVPLRIEWQLLLPLFLLYLIWK